MTPAEQQNQANINRSIRTIKAELEYLCDASVISPQTLSDLLDRVPPQTALHAPLSVGAVPTAIGRTAELPSAPMNNLSLQNSSTNGNAPHNEKSGEYYNNPNTNGAAPTPQAPPPAYAAPPPATNWPPLAQATALYAYTSTDAGDLQLQPNDHVTVTEYMNAEWWKGRSTRTGLEGIFPRSYVKVEEQKGAAPSGYGNAPLDVSGMGSGEGRVPGKGQEMGKKVGKKLGNAALFGAGATIGGNLVNSIF